MSIARDILTNPVLIAAALACVLAQLMKFPLEYLLHRQWNWRLILNASGMPSSHSALVVSAAITIGLRDGFDSSLFALACVLAAIVVYDATGVRRQTGDHARILNLMLDELLTGHPLAEKELKEMLGHTPREVIAGIVWGIVVGWATWRWL